MFVSKSMDKLTYDILVEKMLFTFSRVRYARDLLCAMKREDKYRQAS